MNKPYSKVRKLNTLNHVFIKINFIFSVICASLLGIYISSFIKISWIIAICSILTFIFMLIIFFATIGSKINRLIEDELKKQKEFYVLKTECYSFDQVISKFNNIENLNNNSYLYCLDSNRNLNTIVLYRISDYSKRNIDLQRRYANKFIKLKYPIAKYKNKVIGIKYYHDLKIQMYIVNNINNEILERLKVNQFNNGTTGFICCCLNLNNGDIIVSSINDGDFKRYDRFINEIIRVFEINNIEEREF